MDVGFSKPLAGRSFQDILSQGEVLLLSLDDEKIISILSNSKFVLAPDGIVYDEKHDRVYFTNMGNPRLNDGTVCSVRLDGTNPQIILAKGKIHTPKQLAIDKLNEKLYISDREGLKIVRCNLDGSSLEVLVQTGNQEDVHDAHDQNKWCVGMAISNEKKLFYWTQKGPSKGGQGRVFCASTEGQGLREPICILDNLPEPIDLDVDEGSNTLYWTDRGELPYGNTFNCVRLDSTGRRPAATTANMVTGLWHEILAQNFDEAIGLAFDSDIGRWYISDLGGTIWAFDVESRQKHKVFEDKDRAFTGIALVVQQ